MMPLLGHEVAEMSRPPRLRLRRLWNTLLAVALVAAAMFSAQCLGGSIFGGRS